jgi:hypothetical protein
MPKIKKSQKIKLQNTLDLHHLRFGAGESVEECVNRKLDNFMSRYLLCKSVDITIIVGKGLGSKKTINGKNPLRYYTEVYLKNLGCEWTNGDFMTGQEGSLRICW